MIFINSYDILLTGTICRWDSERYIKMAKVEKELEEITTTDKIKAMKALKDAGYRVEMAGSGVPTIIVPNADEIEKSIKTIRGLLKGISYVGSFGIRAVRKTDMIATDSEEVKTEELTAISA